jgi:hypothetical protein
VRKISSKKCEPIVLIFQVEKSFGGFGFFPIIASSFFEDLKFVRLQK